MSDPQNFVYTNRAIWSGSARLATKRYLEVLVYCLPTLERGFDVWSKASGSRDGVAMRGGGWVVMGGEGGVSGMMDGVEEDLRM